VEENKVFEFKTTKTGKHFCWGIISRSFLTCFNMQNMRKESRENSKKIKPRAKERASFREARKCIVRS